jgi:hypothetical protein
MLSDIPDRGQRVRSRSSDAIMLLNLRKHGSRWIRQDCQERPTPKFESRRPGGDSLDRVEEIR